LTDEEFPLTPVVELREYKKLLKQKMKEYEELVEDSKAHKISVVKNMLKKDGGGKADDVLYAERQIIKNVQQYNGLWTANELFNKVKQNHNDRIKEIKENGQLLSEIEKTQKELELKKQKAKEKNLTIPRKKKEKKD
jgi:hypothetical protein